MRTAAEEASGEEITGYWPSRLRIAPVQCGRGAARDFNANSVSAETLPGPHDRRKKTGRERPALQVANRAVEGTESIVLSVASEHLLEQSALWSLPPYWHHSTPTGVSLIGSKSQYSSSTFEPRTCQHVKSQIISRLILNGLYGMVRWAIELHLKAEKRAYLSPKSLLFNSSLLGQDALKPIVTRLAHNIRY